MQMPSLHLTRYRVVVGKLEVGFSGELQMDGLMTSLDLFTMIAK